MSLAFTLLPRRSRRVFGLLLLAHGCAVLGACLAALHLASGGRLAASALMLATLVAIAWSWWRAWRCRPAGGVLPAGSLRVDDEGAASWWPALPSPGPQRAPQAPSSQAPLSQPFQPVRWLAFAGIVWIEGRLAGRRWRVLSGADAMPDATWRGLMRWLRWLDRGR